MPDFEQNRKTSRLIWLLAALGAIALHAGCVALAVAHMRYDEADVAFGAPAMAIDIDLGAPRVEPSELPPGPEAEASAASPAVAEQKAVEVPDELPKDITPETEDAYRVVTRNDTTKPTEEKQTEATAAAAPSVESVAAEATAPPTIEATRETAVAVAPVQGTGDSARRIRATWQKELLAHLDRHKRYPADRANKGAEIVLSFVLDRTGHIVSSAIAKSSGDAAFDAAALAMLKRSDPVPAPPPLIADDGLTFTLPVVFRVKGRG